MPLEDLIDLGYEVARPPEDEVVPMPLMASTVWGHDRQWFVQPGEDEEAVVQMAINHAKIMDKMTQAQQYFQDNYANWATMTAVQKDAANRQAQRALTNLIRHVRNDMSTEGV